jgi:threonylcarbamoyladenosine tRNA methylthiotransferase MtaB
MRAGIEVIDRPAQADAYVINSCSVTHVADRKARKLVHMARRLAPGAPVVLTGCYVEIAGKGVAEAVGADVALGNRDKPLIAERVAAMRPAAPRAARLADSPLRTRAFVKVQEGCNDVCAFCIVPRTRGREVSVPPERVVQVVREREEAGVQEVVLTGTQLGAYGRHTGDLRPADLIRAVLSGTSVPRIRFSSLQPQDITPDLIALWEDPRLCRHFHLALQSGSDMTLHRMRRRYDTSDYRRAVDMLRAQIGDDLAITTDVIVGFPQELDVEFDESLAFCEEMSFAAIHVFPYSRREGTTAAKMAGHVSHEVKRERMARMLDCAQRSRDAFARRFTGCVMPVLWEESGPRDGGAIWNGLTENYIRVYASDGRELRNRITPARLIEPTRAGFRGEAL